MQKKTLTLKSISGNKKPTVAAAHSEPMSIVAGRADKDPNQKRCHAVLERLGELIQARSKVFIQKRHGPGYCGMPIQLDDGWLWMTEVSVHGTKHTATPQNILIQIRDGAFIAHIHPVESQHKTGA